MSSTKGVLDILNRVKGGNVSLVTDYEVSTRQVFNESGQLKRESTYRNNDLHSFQDQPAVVEILPATGCMLHQKWYSRNKIHRDNGPSAIFYSAEHCNVKVSEQYHQHGVLSRHDGPAMKNFYIIDSKPVPRSEIWYKNGEVHCNVDDQPAERHWTQDGDLSLEVWQQDGNLHRARGPAVIAYPAEGNGYDEMHIKHFKNGVDLGDHPELNELKDNPDAYEFAWTLIDEEQYRES